MRYTNRCLPLPLTHCVITQNVPSAQARVEFTPSTQYSAVMSRLCILTWTKVKRRGEDWSLATRSSYAVAENQAVANAYRTTYLFTVSYQSTIAVNKPECQHGPNAISLSEVLPTKNITEKLKQ